MTCSKLGCNSLIFFCFFIKIMLFWFLKKKITQATGWPSQNPKLEPWTGSGLKTINNKQTINMPLMNVINQAKEVIKSHTHTHSRLFNSTQYLWFVINNDSQTTADHQQHTVWYLLFYFLYDWPIIRDLTTYHLSLCSTCFMIDLLQNLISCLDYVVVTVMSLDI